MAVAYKTRTAPARLRPGRSGLSRGQVSTVQRNRLLTAATAAVDEVGYAHLTVAQVIGRARVSRTTFYDVFRDREDCFLAALELALEHARTLAREAYEQQSSWREGIRAALAELLNFMDEEPATARLCMVEALAAGGRVLERRAKVLDELAAVIDEGRAAGGADHEPPELTAEGIVGAIFAVVHTRLLDRDAEPLTDLLGSLMSIIVLPYLGAAAASEELRRPPMKRRRAQSRRRARSSGDPLAGLKMRLTYRTVRVLSVIAAQPGANNREVAERSGIVDQGQISKLLARLARLELIENFGGGHERGAANAWRLTARGTRVERATRPR